MRVKVLVFGVLKEMMTGESQTLDLPEGSTVESLLNSLLPTQTALRPTLAVAVNQHYATRDHRLQEGDEVALLPPVSGGSVSLTRDPIDTAAISASVKQGEDGAVVTFDGIVRNNSRGRRTLYLEYSAYDRMALLKMEELARQAMALFAVRDVSVVHRVGRLQIGETSVYIAVASAHRAAAFDACRWLIDTLKTTVPIWKKEFFEDGATWADGEPFPKDIPRAGG